MFYWAHLSKCPNENKFKVHWILSLEESKIKKSTQQLQCPLKLQPKELAKKLKAYKFQLHLHLMWDILEEISKISLIFQKDAFSISQVKAEIEQSSQPLENMQRWPGRHLEEVGDGTMFKGASLKRNNTDDRSSVQSKATIITDTK